MGENLIIYTVVFLAFFLKGVAGFGNTLILNGTLSFFRENRFITPMDLLLGFPVNIYLVIREWKYIQFRIVLPLLVSILAGSIPGILLLGSVNDRILKSILALVLIMISIDFFFKKGQKDLSEKEMKYLIPFTGFVSGILMGLYGIGVLIPAVLSRTGLERRNFRGTVCFIFSIESMIRIAAYVYTGIISREILILFISLLPFAAAGVLAGRIADKQIDDNLLRKIIVAVLFVSAVFLLFKNRFGII